MSSGRGALTAAAVRDCLGNADVHKRSDVRLFAILGGTALPSHPSCTGGVPCIGRLPSGQKA